MLKGVVTQNKLKGVVTVGVAHSEFDADAQAFIMASGITDITQKSAINTLVIGLKANSLWTKMKAIYPFVGGIAETHKWNLKDSRDLDVAFRLTFYGGWTHSSTGAKPNGSTGYANTFIVPSVDLSLNSSHLGYYSRTQALTTSFEMGCYTTSGGNFCMISFSYSGTMYALINTTATTTNVANTVTLGLGIGNRRASNIENIFLNTSKLKQTTASSVALPTHSIYLGCRNQNGIPFAYSSKECAFASIGSGLTDANALNLYTLVQAFETTLGRQI